MWDFLISLVNMLKEPVLYPLIISGVTWVLNTYVTFVAKLPNIVKQTAILVVPALLAAGAAKLGLDVSSASAFAASAVALGVFQLGKLKGKANADG